MFYIIAFIFWSILWSFISVLIHRTKTWEWGIILWRSQCPKCLHTLWVLDLFPIFSYIFLKWKCRYCKNKISIVYPFLEIANWLVFVFITYLIVWTSDMQTCLHNINIIAYARVLGSLIVAIAFYDILFYEISFILAAILWVFLAIPQAMWLIWNFKSWIILAIAGFVGFLFISKLRKTIRKIEWLGGWDAIWAALIGLGTPILIELLDLSIYPIWIVFYVLLLMGFLIWAVFWIFVVIFAKKWNSQKILPFLPFMFLAIVLFSFVWKYILDFIV